MQTEFNKNIYDFKDNFWKGLTKRQAIWGGLGLGLGVVMIILSDFVFHIEWGQPVGMVLAFICAFIGFFSRDGLKGEEIIFLIRRKLQTPKILVTKDVYEPPVMYRYGGFHQEIREEIQEDGEDEKESEKEDV